MQLGREVGCWVSTRVYQSSRSHFFNGFDGFEVRASAGVSGIYFIRSRGGVSLGNCTSQGAGSATPGAGQNPRGGTWNRYPAACGTLTAGDQLTGCRGGRCRRLAEGQPQLSRTGAQDLRASRGVAFLRRGQAARTGGKAP